MVVRELLKWGGDGLMRFNGQVDGGISWRGASPQSLSTWLRSAPSTLLSKLMSEAALKPRFEVLTTVHPVVQNPDAPHHASTLLPFA